MLSPTKKKFELLNSEVGPDGFPQHVKLGHHHAALLNIQKSVLQTDPKILKTPKIHFVKPRILHMEPCVVIMDIIEVPKELFIAHKPKEHINL